MQNSRQKKKVSQQKKRYHDRAKGKGQATAATGTKGENIAEVSNSANKTSPAQGTESRTKENHFGTNLDRYEDPPSDGDAAAAEASHKENEEQLQQRLMQLLNLPIHHAPTPPSYHPPFTSTASLTTQDTFSSFPSSSFLTLDCSALADSLSSLPLHTRLDISLDLLELSKLPALDKVEMNTREYQETVAAGIDLTMCSKKNRHRVFEFEKVAPSLRLLSEEQEMNSGNSGGQGERIIQESVNVDISKTSKPGTDARTPEDVELNKLLERNLLIKRAEGMASKNTGDAETVATERVVSSAVASASDNTAAGVDIETTDELDDVLDELLN